MLTGLAPFEVLFYWGMFACCVRRAFRARALGGTAVRKEKSCPFGIRLLPTSTKREKDQVTT